MEPRPLSEKLRRSGQIPVSITPITRSEPKSVSARRPELSDDLRPRNCGERVVSRWRTCSGRIARTPAATERAAAAEGVILAEKPWNMEEYVWIRGPPEVQPVSPSKESASAAATAVSYQWACVGKTDGLASPSTQTMYVFRLVFSEDEMAGEERKKSTARNRNAKW
ncbi:hypothetical protein IEQ34_019937 [Dendrobium chrysotoxum]|uniref:Uncharacterized protein n=1 Tax=Dendrobium chrysotoxum TaxID=161865 RepID=A0AAV7GAC3_DENCH|nr:hypothetical protein IEQ34_019937 [Dendrobium chrysotoxum]